ncbi:hypothetical protein HanRHA438_Chr09g0391771 [Helianthus annuus]|nr:hypothetical protein HanRHA438_Chr09g0391771 [Helianthus annuus]
MFSCNYCSTSTKCTINYIYELLYKALIISSFLVHCCIHEELLVATICLNITSNARYSCSSTCT